MTLVTSIMEILPLIPLEGPPPITPTRPPGMDGLTKILGWVAFIIMMVCIAGFLVSIGRMVIGMRGGEWEGGKGMVIALIGFALVGSVSAIFAAVNLA